MHCNATEFRFTVEWKWLSFAVDGRKKKSQQPAMVSSQKAKVERTERFSDFAQRRRRELCLLSPVTLPIQYTFKESVPAGQAGQISRSNL